MSLDPMHIAITPKEIYDAVIKLTGRVDVLIAREEENTKDLVDHEARIRALERARWPLPTIAVLVSIATLMFVALKFLE